MLASGAAIAFTIDAGGNLYVVPETQFTGGSISWVGTGGGLSVSANGVYPNPYILTPMVGFASGDSVELEDPGVVTAAYTQTIPAGGTVALLDSSGNLLGSLALQGNYVADPFIVTGNNADFVNIALAEPGSFALSAGTSGGDSFTYTGISGGAWGDPANWTETTPSSPIIAPGTNDSVTVGSTGSNELTVITGTGNAATWTLDGNAVAVVGDFTIGTLTAPTDTNSIYDLFIDAGGTLNVGSASFGDPTTFSFVNYDPGFIVNGPGALLNIGGTLTGLSLFGGQPGSANPAGIIAENGGTASIGSLAFSVLLTGDPGLGSGTLPLAADGGGTLILPTNLPSSATPITLSGTDNVLEFNTPTATALAVTPSITGFAVTDTIDVSFATPVDSVTPTLNSTTGATLNFLNSGGTTVSTLSLSGDYTGDTFYSQALSPTTTQILLEVACFLPGTLILTDRGEVAVEDLQTDATIITSSGQQRRLSWIGQGRALATRGRRGAATPVIVRKGSLSDNVPHHDLHITKGHSLYLDGALIPVEYLVNHRSILWDDHAQEVTIYHLELDTHDVLLANGAPAESYRDDGNRWLFRNANAGWSQPPKPPCAPVLTGGPVVDAVWRRLLDRAGPRPGFVLTDDPDLHLLVDGERLDAGERRGTAHIFHLPTRPASLRIVSRAGAPAELGLTRDPRVLGVAIRRIALHQGVRFHVIESADELLTEGFYPFEPANFLRWTDGDAVLPEALFEGFDGPTELVLHVGGTTRYPLFGVANSYAAAA